MRESEVLPVSTTSPATEELVWLSAEQLRDAYLRRDLSPVEVTREQVRKVAQRIFDSNRRTVGVLVPTEEAPAQAGQSKEAGR